MPKKSSNKKASMHKDLKGFDIKVNSFGEIESNFSIQVLNNFLNEQMEKNTGLKKEKEGNKLD
jgi:hypothetical protein